MQVPDLPADQIQRMERDTKYFILGTVGFQQVKRWIAVQYDEKTAKTVAAYIASKLEEELMKGWKENL